MTLTPSTNCEHCTLPDGNHQCSDCGAEWKVEGEGLSEYEHICGRCSYYLHKQ
jgi:hypothetical protein